MRKSPNSSVAASAQFDLLVIPLVWHETATKAPVKIAEPIIIRKQRTKHALRDKERGGGCRVADIAHCNVRLEPIKPCSLSLGVEQAV